ncbi:MAG TPA: hypothetical protein VN702_11980, partial [Acetobacteraceae bacterium]|nr:hypothetical protein [Acetobacteraceae bacterium]
MQRRVFLGLMMSSTALSTLALLSEAEAQTSPPSGNSGQGTSPGPAPAAPVATGPAATGTFMQDYLTGKPFTDSQGREAVYVAPDGTTNLYSPVFFNWQ